MTDYSSNNNNNGSSSSSNNNRRNNNNTNNCTSSSSNSIINHQEGERVRLFRHLQGELYRQQLDERNRRVDELVAKTRAANTLAGIATLFAGVDADTDLYFPGVRPREWDDPRWPTLVELWDASFNTPRPATLADVLALRQQTTAPAARVVPALTFTPASPPPPSSSSSPEVVTSLSPPSSSDRLQVPQMPQGVSRRRPREESEADAPPARRRHRGQ
jgi:hypothetical protein